MKIELKVLGIGMVKNGCGQCCDGTLKLTIWRMNRWNKHFLHVDTDSQKLKSDEKFIDWAWSKMDVASLVKRL